MAPKHPAPRTRTIYPLFIFAALTLAALWKPLFHRDFTLLAGADMSAQTYPWFQAASYWLKRGVLLLWDPYVYSGKATLGEIQPGLLYPLNWLIMLLPSKGGGINITGLELLLFFNYTLAAYFAFLLARTMKLGFVSAAFSGVAFALGGYTAQIHGWVNIFSAFVWLPLFVLLFRKALDGDSREARWRWLLWSAFPLALSVLAGHHAPAVHMGLFALFYAVYILLRDRRKMSLRETAYVGMSIPLAAAVAVMLAAAQVIPSLEYAVGALRWVGEGEPLRWAERIPYSVLQRTDNQAPQDMASLLFPYMTGSSTIYVGVTVLFMALVGLLFARTRDSGFFRIAAFLFLFMSWGGYSAFHGWVVTFLPGTWFAREVYLYLVPFQLCLALLAGFGLEFLLGEYANGPGRTFSVFIRRAGWALALLALFSWVLVIVGHVVAGLAWDHPYLRAAAGLSVYLIILGALLFLLHTRRIAPALFGPLVLAAVTLDLGTNFSAHVQPVERPAGEENLAVAKVWEMPPAARFLKDMRQREFFRVDDNSGLFPRNFGDAWQIDATMGHGATAFERYLDFRGIGWGPGSTATALLNARYFLSLTPVAGMPKVFDEGVPVYFNPRAVPRAFVVARYRSFTDERDLLRWIGTPLFSPQETVLLMEEDVMRLPPPFAGRALDERGNIRILGVRQTLAFEKELQQTDDKELRRTMAIFHAPWGWSADDEVEATVQVPFPTSNCHLLLRYYPAGSSPTHFQVHVQGPDGMRRLAGELPPPAAGADQQAKPEKSALALGPLVTGQYRISLARSGNGGARIDSLHITESPPDQEQESAGTVVITSYRPNRIALRAELTRPGFVVMSELHYPGWEALVDGAPTPLLRGNYILRAVPVEAGEHEIVLRFRPRSFQWGLIISLITLAALAAVLIGRRTRPVSESEPGRF